jgi:hypothetical protein
MHAQSGAVIELEGIILVLVIFVEANAVRRRRQTDSVHCAGLLEDTAVESLERRPSRTATTPTACLRLKIQRKDQTN